MAASPLAQIDWTDLDSADLPLAVSLLAVATQERFNIGTVSRSGGMRSNIGIFDIADRDIFPYKSNDPDWTLNSGDPLGNFTAEVESLLSDIIKVFADTEKWDDAATDKETNSNIYVLDGAADAPGTYDNRLFEITGYTSYPDLSVYAPEEVKKWYDMIAVCTTIFRRSGIENDDYFIYDGVFDTESVGFFNGNPDGAEYYTAQVNPKDNPRTPIADNTVYAAFDTANTALFGTTPNQFDDSTDTGTTPPDRSGGGSGVGPRFYDMDATVSRVVVPDDYDNWQKSWKVTYVADWTDSISAIGFTGKPLSYKNQLKADHTTVLFNTTFTPTITFPASTTADLQRYYTTNVVTQSGDKDEIAVNHLLSPMTMPATVAALNATAIITNSDVGVGGNINVVSSSGETGFSDTQFLELWNGEGGFDSYTP